MQAAHSNMNLSGEIFFNMFRKTHPLLGVSEYMLKRWTKQTIYALSGSYKHPESQSWHSVSDPRYNMYCTNSIYLYDYVLVSDNWFFATVYTSSAIDSTPSTIGDYVGIFNGTASFAHNPNTWRNSPNAIYNNYLFRYNPVESSFQRYSVYGYDPKFTPSFNYLDSTTGLTLTPAQYSQWMKTPIFTDNDTYFEIITGYPRNHYTHKRGYFSAERFMSYGLLMGNTVSSASYRRGMQTSATTIGSNGLEDGSSPVQQTTVTNIDIIQSNNVIYN